MRSTKILLTILAVALALRIGYVLTVDQKTPWVDEVEYLALSEKILDGSGYVDDVGQSTAFRPVGYPLFLSGLRLLGIHSLTAIRIVQAFIGMGNVFLLFLLGTMLYSRNAGLIAAGFAAIYPYFIFLPGTILASTWFSFILVAATILFIKGQRIGNKTLMLAGGVLLGYATLVRPSTLLFIGAVIVWLVLNTQDRKTLAVQSAIVVIAFSAVISPWMIRNYSRLGIFNLSTNGGRNLWLGNNEKATPHTGSNLPPTKEIEEQLNQAQNEVQKDQVYSRAAWEFIRNHPQQTAILFIKKSLAFWRWDPSPTTDGYVKQNKLLWWISVLSFGPIFLLSLFGFAFSSPKVKKATMLFWLYAAAFTFLHAVYFPKVRFRLPLDQFLMVMAGFAVMVIFAKARSFNYSNMNLSLLLPLSFRDR